MTRAHAEPDGDVAEPDLATVQQRFEARGLQARTAATGGTLIRGNGVVMHFADSAGAMAASRQPTADRKEFETLRAELALRGGHSLLELAGGEGYVVTRWDLARHCRDLSEVRAFLARVEATQ